MAGIYQITYTYNSLPMIFGHTIQVIIPQPADSDFAHTIHNGYGTPNRGTGGTYTQMVTYITNHGATSALDYSPTWAKTQTEINNDDPFPILSTITNSGTLYNMYRLFQSTAYACF